ncbi:L-threonylcarbamoyladenylate synthase [Herbinix luporum]|jgi:L-threonylcarbamoyladenylate synthase|uniref:Threonylcarbamoyl-AMP synthase n=1 Tax=Herbinix luporum TaxID=1679721 RepID=A0A0K8J2N3_9FIRM|nr:L-threonylcarbamoyladenylate synthase [Herbinix luporum]MDI9487978.1 L-threonylcarbamoyladenylate synthase [Bacillota bacterium]CUH91720.1 putative tRNA threonylcarbamoyladenosine biosynthesis protein YwlC [Herbinix luporum]
MMTIIKKADNGTLGEDDLKKAAKILQRGGLVAFPTETVYGLGADALNPEAAKKIYEAKGRPSDNPLIVHIANPKHMELIARDIPREAYKLAETFWPGPLTIILNKKEIVPYNTTGGLDTVAIRLPANKIARDVIAYSGGFIAAPSANISGRPSPTRAQHVIDDLDGKIDMIIDGGKSTLGLESTIVDLSGDIPMILRPGSITKSMVESVIGSVEYDKAITKETMDENIAPKAPGMKYRHYAPEGCLVIYEGNIQDVATAINNKARLYLEEGKTVGIIATDETKSLYKYGIIKSIGSRNEEDSIAAGLYAVLRDFDEIHADYIFSESFAGGNLGQAIMNRLLKAAGYRVEKL